METKEKLPLSVAIKNDNVIVIVRGEATMKLSYVVKKFITDLMDGSEGRNRDFKIDLGECSYMDSTFTGLLVILEKYAKTKLHGRFEILNPSKFCQGIIETMGIKSLFKISNGERDYEKQAVQLKPLQVEKTEEAILMYLAHKELSDVSKGNEDQFLDVQKYLKDHIEKETGKNVENIDLNDLM